MIPIFYLLSEFPDSPDIFRPWDDETEEFWYDE